ncbi:hypothetical protein HK098_004793 [Nowakowskiella sp. JEL0407]|nr:hypothetical protein HK098_004793 [Nowakowskiella sp. JEL0407]
MDNIRTERKPRPIPQSLNLPTELELKALANSFDSLGRLGSFTLFLSNLGNESVNIIDRLLRNCTSLPQINYLEISANGEDTDNHPKLLELLRSLKVKKVILEDEEIVLDENIDNDDVQYDSDDSYSSAYHTPGSSDEGSNEGFDGDVSKLCLAHTQYSDGDDGPLIVLDFRGPEHQDVAIIGDLFSDRFDSKSIAKLSLPSICAFDNSSLDVIVKLEFADYGGARKFLFELPQIYQVIKRNPDSRLINRSDGLVLKLIRDERVHVFRYLRFKETLVRRVWSWWLKGDVTVNRIVRNELNDAVCNMVLAGLKNQCGDAMVLGFVGWEYCLCCDRDKMSSLAESLVFEDEEE